MAPVVETGRVKARIQANKAIAYPTDPSIRSSYLALANSDDWTSLGGAKVSPFQWKVYDLVKQIPHGKVTTYATLAQLVSASGPGSKSKPASRGSSQAIGGALKNNPFCPVVPCHRVVKSDGRLGGFFGQTGSADGMKLKVDMLAEEGVTATFDTSKSVWKLDKQEMAKRLWRGV